MKKVNSLISIILSFVIIFCILPINAFAGDMNTYQDAVALQLNIPAQATFRYGYPDPSSSSSVNDNGYYFCFTPDNDGYYEFEVTGYDANNYISNTFPNATFEIFDVNGTKIYRNYTKKDTLLTKGALNLLKNNKYTVYLTYSLVNSKSYRDVYRGFAQETLSIVVRNHNHTFEKKESTYQIRYDCTECDYYYIENKEESSLSVSSCTFKNDKLVYNGKIQVPDIVAIDSKGSTIGSTYYTVYYGASKKDVGIYSVTVKFNSSYNYASYTLKYSIVPKGTSISSAKAKSKAINVKWKKQTAQSSGYQVQVATDKNFKKNVKTLKVTKNSKTSGYVKGLKSKKKYYIRIRTYKKAGSSKIYSDWKRFSKTVKTK